MTFDEHVESAKAKRAEISAATTDLQEAEGILSAAREKLTALQSEMGIIETEAATDGYSVADLRTASAAEDSQAEPPAPQN